MDELIFGDVLLHYQKKLQEASDQIDHIRRQLTQELTLVDTNWKGMAANSCRDKISLFNQELSKAGGEIAETMALLGAISSADSAEDEEL